MDVPLAGGTEALGTLTALEWLGTSVQTEVDFQAAVGGKQLLTDVALVLFDPCVSFQVSSKGTLHCEGFIAKFTFEWLLLRVSPDVPN